MITPVSNQAIYLDKLEQLFASSPTLSKEVDKVYEDVRSDHIFNDYGWYLDQDGNVLSGLRPMVIISEDDFSSTIDTMTADGGAGYVHSGSVGVLITANAAKPGGKAPSEHKASKNVFLNLVGGIIDDVEMASGLDDNLMFAAYEMVMAYARTPVKERTRFNDYWECGFMFHFGTEQ